MSDLKPCPFCGHEANTARLKYRGYDAGCGNYECPVMPRTVWYDTEEEAAVAWNTRAERTCVCAPYDCKCSACGADWDRKPYYCPECGARVVEE